MKELIDLKLPVSKTGRFTSYLLEQSFIAQPVLAIILSLALDVSKTLWLHKSSIDHGNLVTEIIIYVPFIFIGLLTTSLILQYRRFRTMIIYLRDYSSKASLTLLQNAIPISGPQNSFSIDELTLNYSRDSNPPYPSFLR